MIFLELKDGQKLKTTDEIFFVKEGSISNDDGYVHIKGEQIRSGRGLVRIAKPGDIGVWNEEDRCVVFTNINEDGIEIKNDINFSEAYECDYDINLDLFQLVED